jgi:hypothetical protein
MSKSFNSDISYVPVYKANVADHVATRSEATALSARPLDCGFESRLEDGCLSLARYVNVVSPVERIPMYQSRYDLAVKVAINKYQKKKTCAVLIFIIIFRVTAMCT